MIRTIEKNKDQIICCPEQIAYEQGWLTKEELTNSIEIYSKNEYGKYLQKIIMKNK